MGDFRKEMEIKDILTYLPRLIEAYLTLLFLRLIRNKGEYILPHNFTDIIIMRSPVQFRKTDFIRKELTQRTRRNKEHKGGI